MNDIQDSNVSTTDRERELELEVARLQAELDTLRGEDPSTATTRFLAMAAATVDLAVADARREADEIVEEVSAQAEARRDEATRVAAEAEVMVEQMLEEVDRAQERVDEAKAEADAIKAAAEDEAAAFAAAEREKATAELEAIAGVRGALDEERAALETYHEQLHRRVHELAESMVALMNTELPGGAALQNLAVPELDAIVADDRAPEAPVLDDEAVLAEEAAVDEAAVDEPVLAEPVLDEDVELENTENIDNHADVDPLDTPAPVAAESPVEAEADPWVEMLESAVPDEGRIVDMPDSAIDEIPAGPFSTFGGVPIIEDETSDHEEEPVVDDAFAELDDAGLDDAELDDAEPDVEEKPVSAGLFSRARGEEDTVLGFDDLADEEEDEKVGLFGMLGSRLVEQTRGEELATALDADDGEDQAFRQFLDGDDAPDPSRDWLLRPEQG